MALSPDGWLCFSGEVAQSLPEWWLHKTEIFTGRSRGAGQAISRSGSVIGALDSYKLLPKGSPKPNSSLI